VSPFDNSGTKKECVSRIYKGCDGYEPIFAYLGNESYCINVQLHTGKDHCQHGTQEFLSAAIDYARQVNKDNPLQVRMDSGNDSRDKMLIVSVGITPGWRHFRKFTKLSALVE
jgi:hypothetical protein